LSNEPNRCERAYVGNTIGQANGVYDKPLDLRYCDYTNDKSNLKGKSLAAALMSDAKFDGADMSEVIMSKAYAVGASFKGMIFHFPDHLIKILFYVILMQTTLLGKIDECCTHNNKIEHHRPGCDLAVYFA